jgi:hypothetical protein
MEYQSLIITHLHRMWDEQVESGFMTRNEMYDSLHAQESGELDLSPDELDAPIARLMGWDMENMTESQWAIWKNIVDMAAREYITR